MNNVPNLSRSNSSQFTLQIQKMKQEWLSRNVVLILPKGSDEEICKTLQNNAIKASTIIFVVDGEQKTFTVRLLDRYTPVKVIREQISAYLGKDVANIALALLETSNALNDDSDLISQLNFHGLGGEVIHVRVKN